MAQAKASGGRLGSSDPSTVAAFARWTPSGSASSSAAVSTRVLRLIAINLCSPERRGRFGAEYDPAA
jgi:hypothetical protein